MKPEDLLAEIEYRVTERLGLLYTDNPVRPVDEARVRREVIEDVRTRWPVAYAKAVEMRLLKV